MTAQAIVGVDGDEVSLGPVPALRPPHRPPRCGPRSAWYIDRGVPAMLRQAVMAPVPAAPRPGEPERVRVG